MAFSVGSSFCSCHTDSDLNLVLPWYVVHSTCINATWLMPLSAESPRWLLKKHRIRESFESFCRLRNTEVMAARDLVSLTS